MENLYGLVVCGGQSTRMGTDKSLLKYHDIAQRYYVYQMLEGFCDKVFISCNTDQAIEIDEFYNLIIDKPPYVNIGPMAALLSANLMYPDASFLVLGCEYPFITQNDLKKLIESRETETEAICFYNPETQFEEPLLAIYENRCLVKLHHYFKEGNYSVRHFLKTIKTKRITPSSFNSITSVDTIKQYKEALLKLKDKS